MDKQRQLTTILSIAGSDCSGGAGIQADIRAAALHGVFAATAVTAVTVQNSRGLAGMDVMSAASVVSQIEAVFEDVRPDAIKIGMIGSLDNGIAIADFLKTKARGIPVVIDPVMKATAGGNLSADIADMASFYACTLSPLATVVTPNLNEAKIFGCYNEDPADAAKALLHKLRCTAVVLKDGHSEKNIITDVLAFSDGKGDVTVDRVSASKIECNNLHGTGCSYSSILAAELAKGISIKEAFRIASTDMKAIISRSGGYSLGQSPYGPLNMFDYHLSAL